MTPALYGILDFVLGSAIWWFILVRSLSDLSQRDPVRAWSYLPWMSLRISVHVGRRLSHHFFPFVARSGYPKGTGVIRIVRFSRNTGIYRWLLTAIRQLRSRPFPWTKVISVGGTVTGRWPSKKSRGLRAARIWPFIVTLLATPVGCVLDLISWPMQRYYKRKLLPRVVADKLKRANGWQDGDEVINQANPGMGSLTLHAPRTTKAAP